MNSMIIPLIRVVIVEDQPDVRNEIKFRVEREYGFKVVSSCGTVREAKQLITQLQPDLLLLDVHLPDGTGFDILKESTKEFKVIFLTAYEKHAIQAIKFGALDYLVKPIDEDEFSEALKKVSHFFPTKPEQLNIASKYHTDDIKTRIVLRSQDYLQVVEINQITYCHSNSGYTTFHLNDGRKIMVSKILRDYEDVLTEPAFLRPHQSYLLNINYIDGLNKTDFIRLKSGEEIPVATRRKEYVKEFFNSL